MSPDASPLWALVVAALMGLGGLVAWAVRVALPPVLDTMRERTKAISDAVAAIPALVAAVERIPAALDRFEERFERHEERVMAKIEERRLDGIKDEIRRLAEDDPPSPPTRRRG